jgi:hypothetical protein
MLRNKVLKRLRRQDITINPNLPKVEEKEIRTAKEVAERINILGIFNVISADSDSIPFFLNHILDNNWFQFLSQTEKAVFEKKTISNQEEIDFSWYSEGIYALAWCLGLIENMSDPFSEANLDKVDKMLPPEVQYSKFISNVSLRDLSSIIEETEYYYGLHWAIRHPEARNTNKHVKSLNLSIIRERRRALEWVIDNSLDWDDIQLDT